VDLVQSGWAAVQSDHAEMGGAGGGAGRGPTVSPPRMKWDPVCRICAGGARQTAVSHSTIGLAVRNRSKLHWTALNSPSEGSLEQFGPPSNRQPFDEGGTGGRPGVSRMARVRIPDASHPIPSHPIPNTSQTAPRQVAQHQGDQRPHPSPRSGRRAAPQYPRRGCARPPVRTGTGSHSREENRLLIRRAARRVKSPARQDSGPRHGGPANASGRPAARLFDSSA
jgi:hypothetical protein